MRRRGLCGGVAVLFTLALVGGLISALTEARRPETGPPARLLFTAFVPPQP